MTVAAERVLDALGDPTRRQIFRRLRRRTLSVGEITAGMEVSRPAVSQHLRVLERARLVRARPQGTRRLYAVDSRGLATLREWLDGFWDEALTAFRAAAEAEFSKERKR